MSYIDEVELAFDVLSGVEVDVYTMCNYSTASNTYIAKRLGISLDELFAHLEAANAKMAAAHARLEAVHQASLDARNGLGL